MVGGCRHVRKHFLLYMRVIACFMWFMWFMYVTRVPNRSSPPAVLLRESWREGGKVKTRMRWSGQSGGGMNNLDCNYRWGDDRELPARSPPAAAWLTTARSWLSNAAEIHAMSVPDQERAASARSR